MNNFTICWYNKVSNDTEFFRWKAFDEWEVDFVPAPENFPLKRFKFHLAHRKIVEQSKVIQCYVGVLKWNSWGKMPLLGSAPKSRERVRSLNLNICVWVSQIKENTTWSNRVESTFATVGCFETIWTICGASLWQTQQFCTQRTHTYQSLASVWFSFRSNSMPHSMQFVWIV